MDALKCRQPPPTIIEDKSSRHIHTKKYKVCGHLGKGGFANVYRVQSIDSKNIYACKVINKSKLVHHEHKRKLISEIKLHSSIKHENIVKFERHFEDKTNVYILLEVCSNKSLMELSIKRRKLTENEVRYFMLQILQALKFLHSRCIIHRDLKLGNILLDANLNIKLCDFGLAAKLEFDSERKTTICGTPNYTAPEILNQRKSGEGHSYEVDVWAIGVIMFTLLSGKPPFETKNIKETYRRIKKIKYEFPINSDKYISLHAKDLISKIFTKDPTKRPNILQIRNHSFFTQLQIPKILPIIILKRKPTYDELFPSNNNNENININNSNNNIISNTSNKRPPLISTGFKQKLNNNFTYNNYNYNFNNFQYNKYNQHNNKLNKLSNEIIGENNNNNNNIEDDDIKNGKNKIDLQLHSKLSNEKHGEILKINSDKLIGDKPMEFNDFISIIKYVDYTKKYGFGYVLSNGSTGIYFNDSTKILLLKNKENVMYINNQSIKQNCTMINYPNVLKKKLTLLKHFTDYLWKTDDDKKEENDNINILLNKLKISPNENNYNYNNSENNIYLKTFVSDNYCLLFKLSNNMVQVNFTDKSQLLIIDKVVSYKDKTGNKNTFKLHEIGASNKKDLKKRLKYTQQLLQKIALKKSKSE